MLLEEPTIKEDHSSDFSQTKPKPTKPKLKPKIKKTVPTDPYAASYAEFLMVPDATSHALFHNQHVKTKANIKAS